MIYRAEGKINKKSWYIGIVIRKQKVETRCIDLIGWDKYLRGNTIYRERYWNITYYTKIEPLMRLLYET